MLGSGSIGCTTIITDLLEADIDYQSFPFEKGNDVHIGIDPRAASATRALLRLTPCHRTYLRPRQAQTSGIPGSLELTGGEYKT